MSCAGYKLSDAGRDANEHERKTNLGSRAHAGDRRDYHVVTIGFEFLELLLIVL